MATMVKEKKRDKKKSKEKSKSQVSDTSQLTISNENIYLVEPSDIVESPRLNLSTREPSQEPGTSESTAELKTITTLCIEEQTDINTSQTEWSSCVEESVVGEKENMMSIGSTTIKTEMISKRTEIQTKEYAGSSDLQGSNTVDTYKELSKRLEIIIIPNEPTSTVTEEREHELEAANAYLVNQEVKECQTSIQEDLAESQTLNQENKAKSQTIKLEIKERTQTLNQEDIKEAQTAIQEEYVTPSAPFLEEIPQCRTTTAIQKVAVATKPKLSCMAIEDVVRLYGGAEMEEVRVMSEKEEAIVEAGPLSGPEHPLVDLLSTFRSSLIAVERERTQLAQGYVDEERFRSTLWKIEKRYVNLSEECQCGAKVNLRTSYEYAKLLKEKLPVAKLRLEGLLRDVQDSYCHHQHAALLAHSQIEDLVTETVNSNKSEIREALSLILQALRLSDTAPAALASALQRWAAVLAAALVDARDLRQLLFLLHHLFRQTRSVSWAARVVRVSVESAGWGRALAVLQLLLARTRIDAALECTEETEEAWEEVDRHGGGGAVSEGTLRERDLLALLKALPLRELAGRPLCARADISKAREYEWGDSTGGSGVLRACYGVRVLLATLQRGSDAHPSYARLRATLRSMAGRTLQSLACLHLSSRAFYTKDIEEKLAAELEAAFATGFKLFSAHELNKLPSTLLSDETAKDYCIAYIVDLHDKSVKHLDSLGVELPVLPCEVRVRIVTQAAIDRADDHELATIVLEFLLQTGIKRKTAQCKSPCDAVARECVPRLLSSHPYLYAVALHLYAEMSQTEPLDASSVKVLHVHKWIPNSGEIRTLLDDWAQRCAQLLQHLLLEIDYTPYVGLPLDVQLSVGSWLCGWIKSSSPGVPEWAWQVVRRLRPHRASWCMPLDAPPPDEDPADLFSTAYALLASSWGHCIPLICSEGVSALCKLAVSRPREAVHCLSSIMLVMAHSPESVALTPQFTELFTTLLNSGPSLVQRTFGRGGVSGSEMLLRLILAQLAEERCGDSSRGSLLAAWLHALWRAALPAPAAALADMAARATREWPHLDAYAAGLLQEENGKEHINSAIRNVSTAPLLCECILRACHTHREARTHTYAQLASALYRQRTAGQRIHVDNAVQQIGANMSSEELVIYRAAAAVQSAPAHHPAHLTLWRLFMHLYLQRPPEQMLESTPPVGPLFFSGLIKSRTLAQIKRRLQDTIAHHRNEIETLKAQQKSLESKPTKSPKKTKKLPPIVDDSLLPALSIVDLTGESSESSGSSDSEESVERVEIREKSTDSDSTNLKKDLFNLIAYHTAAEKLTSEYYRWLEEGEKVRAAPHHADIARFIPEHALDAAWKHSLSREKPAASPELDSFPLPQLTAPPYSPPPQTPFHKAVNSILKIRDRSGRRQRRTTIMSPVDDVDFKDSRSLLALVDKHLKDIERLAQEWCNEVYRVSSLDSKLWEHVGALRVRKPLPPVRMQCANKCKPFTVNIPAQEWCISLDAERAIKENRSNARSAVRRLARPRPHAARTAAALHVIARRVRSNEAGVRVAERAWRCAAHAHCARAAPAAAALSALVDYLAEHWICHDGKLSTELVSRWCNNSSSSLQEALCGALVSPRRLPPASWPPLYAALLTAKLPPHTAFSYLSKFELTRWSEIADSGQRRDMLDALSTAVQRFGPSPSPEHTMLVELLGVHTSLLLDGREVGNCVLSCARASVVGSLPPTHWGHVVRAVEANAPLVPFDQLGHLLRELGVLWWEARTGLRGKKGAHHATYAPQIARLLHALQRAFVGAARRLSYEPERVAWYAWSGLQESWGAWVCPHAAAAPLLPSACDSEQYTPMLRHFVDNVHQIMLDCPGSEVHLLQQIFEWCLQTYGGVQGPGSSQESRVQASALLAELAKLPWPEHQWFYGKCHQVALQVSTSTDQEITSWCCSTWSHTTADTLVRDSGAGEQLAPKLAALLYLFTGTLLQHSQQVLEEATLLPWWRLPETALDEALDRFFMVHHNPAQPYHELPQFRVILFASELRLQADSAHVRHVAVSRRKRGVAVSQWVRAACAPALATHVTGHSNCMLDTLTELAPFLEDRGSEGELEELLSRAVVIMCMEPAAAAALPVWTSWVRGVRGRLVRACLSAAAVLTVFEYFATLADAAAQAHMTCTECNGWHEVCSRWSSSPWREPQPLVSRRRLHAAYASALQHAHHSHAVRAAIPALLNADINFVENEPIVAVWICYACRIARECVGVSGDGAESRAAAAALLAKWAEAPRRSLLRVVTLHADTDRPTPLHRMLCRFALSTLSPSEATTRAYEAACSSALGASDLTSWACSPHARKLPRLAARLFPHHEIYFKWELDIAPEETA